MDHATPRYLHAKESVDERARSGRVRDRLLAALPDDPQIVDLGCGTGVTVSNLRRWGVDRGRYRGIDTAAPIVTHARAVRPEICRQTGATVSRDASGWTADGLDCRFRVGEALASADEQFQDGADVVVAQAFLDLVDLDDALAAVRRALAPSGLLYAPITFDGVTCFQPDHPDDEAVQRAYHAAIDTQPGRDSRAGRHLLDRLRDRAVLAVDSADWIVRPRDGTYPADERYFLSQILSFVADALAESAVDGTDWLTTRRAQLEAGALTYVAHQYDFLARL
ncbi:methyltransferase domain-containing protein [Halomicrobium mukohataei]|uniref:Methyltransferase domain-containing protein n=2 Tax=Haloarculaceae TaxID=1963268 RepID=A0A847UBD8_9EURY|nr:class I SAM-dependent methyltransferase [Halomicrobium mukohataei]NLV09547.1 methyltransferase domain-containing protein [Halomicrobium mukohataei]